MRAILILAIAGAAVVACSGGDSSSSGEPCASNEALSDSTSSKLHGEFGTCGQSARAVQNFQ
jgi:hypothetical protein